MKHNKRKILFPWLAVCFPAVAIVEACFQKWFAVKAILAIGALLTPIWMLMLSAAADKGQAAPSGVLGALWQGDWIRTQDPKKKRRLFFLARLAIPAAFVAFVAVRMGGGMNLEATLILTVWLLSILFAAAMEIRRDLRAEEAKQPPAPRQSAAPVPQSAREKRLRQLDEWLELGLIDRNEYLTMKKKTEEESP